MIRRTLMAVGMTLTLTLMLAAHAAPAEQALQLPELGDSTSGLISGEQEHELGRAWLKAFLDGWLTRMPLSMMAEAAE